jgi:hypothetical protein
MFENNVKSVGNYRFKSAELGKFNSTNSDPAVAGMKEGSRIIGLTMGRFSLIDLIHSILEKTGPAHIVVATWSAGIKDAHQVKWMLDSKLIRTFKLCTDHSYKTRQAKYAASIEDLFGRENIRTSEIHAKFTLIHNENWNVCIRTSMNLNANATCESFEIDCDKEIFDFYMQFIESTFGNMPTGFCTQNAIVASAVEKFFNVKTDKKHVNHAFSDL